MILSGAPISSLPFGAIPNGVDFVVAVPDTGADIDLSGKLAKAFGLKVDPVTGWLTAPAQQFPTVTLPGLQGVTKTDTIAREGALDLKINGVLEGSSVSDGRAKFDALKLWLLQAPVRVITPDAVTRYLVADITAISAESYGPQFRQRKVPVEITLLAADPYRYDLCLSGASAGSGVRARLPLGTAPVRPVVTITGPGTNPVVTLRDWNGNVIATMTFGATVLVAGDLLVIDCSAMTVTKNGVAALTALTAGDFFKLDPATIADRPNSRWPTLETSVGSIAIAYARAWR